MTRWDKVSVWIGSLCFVVGLVEQNVSMVALGAGVAVSGVLHSIPTKKDED